MPMSPYTYLIAAVDLAAQAGEHSKNRTSEAEDPTKPTRSKIVAVFCPVRDYATATVVTLLFCIILMGVAFTSSSNLTQSTIYGADRGFAGGISGTPESLRTPHQESAHWLLEQYGKIDHGDLENVEGLDGIGDYRVQNYRVATPEQRVDLRRLAETAITKSPLLVLAQRTGKRLMKSYLYHSSRGAYGDIPTTSSYDQEERGGVGLSARRVQFTQLHFVGVSNIKRQENSFDSVNWITDLSRIE